MSESLSIYQRLVEANPQIADYRRSLSYCQNCISNLLRKDRRHAQALEGYDRALAIAGPLAQEFPKNTWYVAGLAVILRSRSLFRAELADFAGAAADTRRALAVYNELPMREAQDWFGMACCHATLAALAGRGGSGVPTADASGETDAAMALLDRAIGQGYRNPDTYRTEEALDPLRGREDFKLLMMDLAFPADPFATAP